MREATIQIVGIVFIVFLIAVVSLVFHRFIRSYVLATIVGAFAATVVVLVVAWSLTRKGEVFNGFLELTVIVLFVFALFISVVVGILVKQWRSKRRQS